MAQFKSYSVNVGGRLLEIDRPQVMGILNVTPDSFYGGSRCGTSGEAIRSRVRQMVAEGADIIDVGGYSSRPGAADVPPGEETRRLEAGIAAVKEEAPGALISVDTFRADVARHCVEELGAHMINDISGGDLDPAMAGTVASLGVPYIAMHMRGTPATMSQLAHYGDVTAEVVGELAAKVARLRQLGVRDVIVDPGFGFSKTVGQNYQLMREIGELASLECPVLVGVSRKSMIYKLLSSSPEEALAGTTVLNTLALMAGVHLLRVHDVRPAVEAVKIVGAVTGMYTYQ